MKYTAESFLAALKPYVIEDMKKSGILASLTASQALIESNKGNSGLAVKGMNLFGIKGSYQGQSIKMEASPSRSWRTSENIPHGQSRSLITLLFLIGSTDIKISEESMIGRRQRSTSRKTAMRLHQTILRHFSPSFRGIGSWNGMMRCSTVSPIWHRRRAILTRSPQRT